MAEQQLTVSVARTQRNNKLLGLEIIRFVAAFAVLIWHYQHFYHLSDEPTHFVREHQPLYAFLHIFYEYGLWGVQVFWCVSGFIFFWKYSEPISEGLISSKKFFILRFSRLYPLHIISLLLVAILQAVYLRLHEDYFIYPNNDVRHFILQLFMASDWGFQEGLSFNGPIWSISVEVLTYILFFSILRVLGKSVVVNIAVLILCGAAELAKVSHPIFGCLALFYVGGLTATASRSIENHRYRIALYAAAWCLMGLIPIFIWLFKLFELKSFKELFLMIYTPVLLLCLSRNINVNTSIQRLIEAAGNMTYSSYLLHFPIQLAIAICFSMVKTPIPFHDQAFLTLFITFTLIASYFTYRYFEAPIQHTIRRKLL